MLRKKVWMIVALFLVFLPSALLAKERNYGKWWQDNATAEQLQLTDKERKVLDDMYTESRLRLVDLRSAVEKERIELDRLLYSPDATSEQIAARYDNLLKARENLSKERFGVLIQMRDIIGIERFKQLKSMHRERGRDRTKKHFWNRD